MTNRYGELFYRLISKYYGNHAAPIDMHIWMKEDQKGEREKEGGSVSPSGGSENKYLEMEKRNGKRKSYFSLEIYSNTTWEVGE